MRTPKGVFYVPALEVGDAQDGDLVELRRIGRVPASRRPADTVLNRPAARVERVCLRAGQSIVGRYEVAEPFGVVVPANECIDYDIFTLRHLNPQIEDGDIVRAHITVHRTASSAAMGVIDEVLGHADDPDVAAEFFMARHQLPASSDTEMPAWAADARVDVTKALASGYYDLRNRVLFTIDPDNAYDFDDALSLECVSIDALSKAKDGLDAAEEDGTQIGERSPEGAASSRDVSSLKTENLHEAQTLGLDGAGLEAARALVARGRALWRLGVHIADVSHYVPWDSSLDREARRRATSIYLVDRVIPMLPEYLSADLCSLLPGKNRRAVSVDVYLDAQARVVCADIFCSIISSRARLTYDQVQNALDALGEGDVPAAQACIAKTAPKAAPFVVARLAGLDALARQLYARRMARGAIDVSGEEVRIILDAKGRAKGVKIQRKNAAMTLVEEAMVAANEAVACFLYDRTIASIWRVHEPPAPRDVAEAGPILQELGYDRMVSLDAFAAGDAAAFQQVLEVARGRPEEYVVSRLVVRAMKQALYKSECGEHFGLACPAYVHFTSPIRRYPDLMVHRALKATLFGRTDQTAVQENLLSLIAQHASDAERTADAVESESRRTKLCELLVRRVGQEEEGMVSSVKAGAFKVRLADTVEGKVVLKKEGWQLDADRCRLTNSQTGQVIRVGMRVRIRIKKVVPITGKVIFTLVEVL